MAKEIKKTKNSQIRLLHQNTKDIIDLPLDNEDQKGNKEGNLRGI